MITQFSANTRELGWKRFFNSSYLVKLFTWWEIRPEVRAFFGLKDIHDCPTHSWVTGEMTISGAWIIFEAKKTMEMGYKYYPCRTFDYKCGTDIDLFRELIRSHKGKVYAIWQWINFIKRGLYWWIFGYDNLKSKQWFTWLWHCSEICYDDMTNHTKDYKLPNLTEILSGINKNVYSPAQIYNTIYDSKGELKEV